MTRLLVLATFCLTAPALAGSRIAVMPFTGPHAVTPRKNLYFPLCKSLECVNPASASKGGKPDMGKARKSKIDALVVGNVVKAKKKLTLEVKLVSTSGGVLTKKRYPLAANGKLAPKSVKAFLAASVRVLKKADARDSGPEESEEEEEEAPPAVARRGSDAPTREAAGDDEESSQGSRSTASGSAEDSSPDTRSDDALFSDKSDSSSSSGSSSYLSERSSRGSSDNEVTRRVERPSKGANKAPLFVAQVGTEFFAPNLKFMGVGSANLRNYSSPMVLAPNIHVEGYPMAPFTNGMLRGLGLELGYGFSIASRTRKADDTAVFPTSASRFDIGARFRIEPIARSKFAITPVLGFRMQSFSVGKSAENVELDGLPGISYKALRLGGELGAPVYGGLSAYLNGAYLQPFGVGEIGETYFPTAQAQGAEFGGGVGYTLLTSLDVRLMVNYTRWGFKFTPASDAKYLATGATDTQFGGALQLRYTY